MDTVLTWQYNGMQVGPAFSTVSTPDTITPDLVGGITFAVNYIFNNGGILMSTLSFIAVMATDGQIITCVGSGNIEQATIQIWSGKDHWLCTCSQLSTNGLLPTDSPPVVSVVGVVSVANDTSTTTLAIEWTIANGVGGVLTVAVDPVAPYTPLASGAGNTYSTNVTLLYNTNYSVEATATSCGGTNSSQISLLQGTATEVYSSKAQGVCWPPPLVHVVGHQYVVVLW